MNIYVGSDFHWGHKNIIDFCPSTRSKYKDVNHMNESMIHEWNSIVKPGDLVYILGDFAFMSGTDSAKILTKLAGDKILVVGNHDQKSLKSVEFRNSFKEIHNYLEIYHNKTMVVMCHYPFAKWNKMHYGSVALHGHLHGEKSGMEKYRCRDVGMDSTGKILTLLDDMVSDALKGEIQSHH